jgi:hypothetical protein
MAMYAHCAELVERGVREGLWRPKTAFERAWFGLTLTTLYYVVQDELGPATLEKTLSLVSTRCSSGVSSEQGTQYPTELTEIVLPREQSRYSQYFLEAASKGHPEIVDYLTLHDRACTLSLNEHEQNAWHLAAEHGAVDTLRVLRLRHVEGIDQLDKDGVTPLCLAAICVASRHVVQELSLSSPALTAPPESFTPLMFAIMNDTQCPDEWIQMYGSRHKELFGPSYEEMPWRSGNYSLLVPIPTFRVDLSSDS